MITNHVSILMFDERSTDECPLDIPFSRPHPVPKAGYGALSHQLVEESIVESETGWGEVCRDLIGHSFRYIASANGSSCGFRSTSSNGFEENAAENTR